MIVVAMFVQSTWTGTCGLLGLLCSTTTAVALSLDAGAIRSGLFGYNGYLVGLAMGTFHPVAWACPKATARSGQSPFASRTLRGRPPD